MAKTKTATKAAKAVATRRATRVRPRILVLGSSANENIRRAGGEPVVLDSRDLRSAEAAGHENIHGLLLLGGGDLDPTLYGVKGKRDATVYGVDQTRDLAEWYALDAARKRGIPVMGICRGAQMMNVHGGGTLFLDIQRDGAASGFHRGHDHRVEAVRGSRLAKAWQASEQWVISIHHQAVADVAPGMVATGFSKDGIVEAIESVEGWELGVQFHPEMAVDKPAHQRLFDRFVYAAGLAAGIKVVPETWSRPITPPAPPKAASRPTTKHKTTRRGRDYQGTWGGPVTVTWRCFKGCGVRFDLEDDYYDHMVLLHDVAPYEMEGTDPR